VAPWSNTISFENRIRWWKNVEQAERLAYRRSRRAKKLMIYRKVDRGKLFETRITCALRFLVTHLLGQQQVIIATSEREKELSNWRHRFYKRLTMNRRLFHSLCSDADAGRLKTLVYIWYKRLRICPPPTVLALMKIILNHNSWFNKYYLMAWLWRKKKKQFFS